MYETRTYSEVSSSSEGKTITSVRFISGKKWKKTMFMHLDDMKNIFPSKTSLLDDFITIVSSISEEKITQATLSIRPFKPQFVETNPILIGNHESTMAETISKVVREKDPVKMKQQIVREAVITEKTLTKEFDQKYHPFKFIIKNFAYLQELKAKSKKKVDVEELKERIRSDLRILEVFLQRISEPYYVLFQTSTEEKSQYQKKLNLFISQYIRKNAVLTKCLKKIITKNCLLNKVKAKEKLEDFSDPKNFDIDPNFQIDGFYIRSMNSLMEFSDEDQPMKLLQKLQQFRANILVDINNYYLQITKEPKNLELNAETQIQIIRYMVTKLKNWSCEIYAMLRFLELIFGEEEIGYKFDDASFMYTQLCLVFQIFQF